MKKESKLLNTYVGRQSSAQVGTTQEPLTHCLAHKYGAELGYHIKDKVTTLRPK